MTVSIIICTRNRVEALRLTLDSLATVDVPEDIRCEALIIDNGSSDGTEAMVRSREIGDIVPRYVSEPRAGQCFARNRGIAEAHGDVLVFTDDDLRFPPNWIEGMCRPILSGVADVVQGGVRIAPHLLRPWMNKEVGAYFASTARMDSGKPDAFVGANFAFSARILDRVPRFDTELGPGAMGFGDDTLFGWQVREAGFEMAFAPDVEVEHHFDPDRLTHASLTNTVDKMARSFAYLRHHWSHGDESFGPKDVLRASVRLGYWRLKRFREMRAVEGMPDWEINQLRTLSYMRQFLHEQKRVRNYEKHGLRKATQSDTVSALLPV